MPFLVLIQDIKRHRCNSFLLFSLFYFCLYMCAFVNKVRNGFRLADCFLMKMLVSSLNSSVDTTPFQCFEVCESISWDLIWWSYLIGYKCGNSYERTLLGEFIFIYNKKIIQIFEFFFLGHNSISYYQNKAKPTKIPTQSFQIRDKNFSLFDGWHNYLSLIFFENFVNMEDIKRKRNLLVNLS